MEEALERGPALMKKAILVGLGGGAGAVFRYSLMTFIPGGSAVSIVFINVGGSLLLGFLTGQAGRGRADQRMMLAAGTGFCGGFTTFSAFSAEVHDMLQSYPPAAFLYLLVSGASGMAAAFIGLRSASVEAGRQS